MFPKIFGIIDSYYVAILIGVFACFGYLHIYAKKKGLAKGAVLSIEAGALIAIIAGIISAILFQNIYDFIEKGSSYTWTWAMTFYGGLIGGVVAFVVFYYCYIQKRDGKIVRQILQVAPSMIAVAHGFGRIGCFLDGCCYGKETDSWIGVLFPGMAHKVIPTNLMEAVFLLLLSAALLCLAVNKFNDYAFGVYGIAYGVWRFIIEFYRGDHRGEFIGNITPSQFWSIVMMVGGLVYLLVVFLLKKKYKKLV